MKYSFVQDKAAFEAAYKLARGCFQRNILLGNENLSCSSLRGKAKQYSGRYKTSIYNLLKRCRENNIPMNEIRGRHGTRILVIG